MIGAYAEDSSDSTITNGARASNNNGVGDSGAAYVFVRSGSTWAMEAYLKAPNVGASDNFGYAVSISGDTIVVGARYEDSSTTAIINDASASESNAASNAGAAYVFVRSGNTWSHQAYLKAFNAGASDQFGWSVSVLGDTVVVGALYEDSNQKSITNGGTVTNNNSKCLCRAMVKVKCRAIC